MSTGAMKRARHSPTDEALPKRTNGMEDVHSPPYASVPTTAEPSLESEHDVAPRPAADTDSAQSLSGQQQHARTVPEEGTRKAMYSKQSLLMELAVRKRPYPAAEDEAFTRPIPGRFLPTGESALSPPGSELSGVREGRNALGFAARPVPSEESARRRSSRKPVPPAWAADCVEHSPSPPAPYSTAPRLSREFNGEIMPRRQAVKSLKGEKPVLGWAKALAKKSIKEYTPVERKFKEFSGRKHHEDLESRPFEWYANHLLAHCTVDEANRIWSKAQDSVKHKYARILKNTEKRTGYPAEDVTKYDRQVARNKELDRRLEMHLRIKRGEDPNDVELEPITQEKLLSLRTYNRKLNGNTPVITTTDPVRDSANTTSAANALCNAADAWAQSVFSGEDMSAPRGEDTPEMRGDDTPDYSSRGDRRVEVVKVSPSMSQRYPNTCPSPSMTTIAGIIHGLATSCR